MQLCYVRRYYALHYGLEIELADELSQLQLVQSLGLPVSEFRKTATRPTKGVPDTTPPSRESFRHEKPKTAAAA